MNSVVLKFSFIFLVLLLGSSAVYCQITPDGSRSNDPLNKEDLPDAFKETLAKQRIKEEEKEFQTLVQRSEEAFKLSEELSKDFDSKHKLSAEDIKKVDQLEKVVKKIRQDLGAKNDDGSDDDDLTDSPADKPSSLVSALKNIKDTTGDLLAEVKKATRHSISVVAIQSSNSLLRMVRFVKFNNN
jgi:membrane-associated HD superfamily phosphohydrolase